VVGDLVHDGLGDDGPELLVVLTRLAFDRASVDRDPVGKDARVVLALRLGDPLVETEEIGFVRGWLVLNDHRHVVNRLLHPTGKLVEGVGDEGLEPASGAARHRL
jgi:hypothetical protein